MGQITSNNATVVNVRFVADLLCGDKLTTNPQQIKPAEFEHKETLLHQIGLYLMCSIVLKCIYLVALDSEAVVEVQTATRRHHRRIT